MMADPHHEHDDSPSTDVPFHLQEPEIAQGDVGGDSISRDEVLAIQYGLNSKLTYDATLQLIHAQNRMLIEQAKSIEAQNFALRAQLDAQTVQQRDQLFANTVQAQRNSIEREGVAAWNAIHSNHSTTQQTIDHRDLSFDSVLPNANIGTATEGRGAGRILAGAPDDTVNVTMTPPENRTNR
jgi:hypothetical protein